VKELIKSMVPEPGLKRLRQKREIYTNRVGRRAVRFLHGLRLHSDEIVGFLLEREPFTPELVIRGYHRGLFPSAIHATGDMRWHSPDERGVVPIENFHLPRRLRQIVRQGRFEIRVDEDFAGVMKGCAEPAPGRQTTYIKPEVMEVYEELHRRGIAHSVGAWLDGQLVGGTYGVALGAYFASESAFQRVRDASKVATVHLTEILTRNGFTLHDVWWHRKDMEQYGGHAIPREEFKELHTHALATPARFAKATL
jgi:leucyl/phenylalanyl-tRNA--protein transferase